MIKRILTLIIFLINSIGLFAQANEILPIGTWHDESLVVNPNHNLRYNDIWGVVNNNIEYAIIGSTEGVHFIDLSNPSNLTEKAFVAGAANGAPIVHRDIKSYKNYAYVVCDENVGGDESTLQVIDFSYLPDSVHVVYDSKEFMSRAHNCWVDGVKERFYTCGVRSKSSNTFIPFQIYDITNPEKPDLLVDALNFSNGASIPYAHDLYVRNDTAFLNCGGAGLYVVDCKDPQNLVLLGTLTDYPQKGYNHSGWWDEAGEYYYLADETHGTDIKTVSTVDLTDLSVVSLFDAESSVTSIVHNLIVHDDLLYVSYYYDGLQIYDVHNPLEPVRIAYYDTFSGEDGEGYQGAWGVYPLLPSGKILLSDMHTGLYVFDKAELVEKFNTSTNFDLFPNPSRADFSVTIDLKKAGEVQMEIIDDTGKLLLQKRLGFKSKGAFTFTIEELQNFAAGKYLVNIRFGKELWQKYLIKL